MSSASADEVERYRRLDAALRVITSDLTLPTLLDRVARSACEIVETRFAALALVDTEDGLGHLVHHGLEDATARYLGELPTLARLKDVLDEWPRYIAAACPAGVRGPSAESTEIISAPVVIGDEHYADLYVAGPNAGGFSAADRELTRALARMVAPVIGHAQLFDRARRSADWLHASGEVARALLAGADIDLFTEIVARAVDVADADFGQIVIPAERDQLEVIAASGLGADELLGRSSRNDVSEFTRAVVAGRTTRLPNVTAVLSEGFPNPHDYGPAMLAPLLDARGTRGSVVLVRTRGRAQFTAGELDQFATYASQVALAMQFADSRVDSAHIELLETRNETARDLHDIVMQRLFATGMGLNTLSEQLADRDQAAQLARYVGEMDETIEEIRARVFRLSGDAHPGRGRRSHFPRIDLPEAQRRPGSAPRRGRRRTDWEDGTGNQRR